MRQSKNNYDGLHPYAVQCVRNQARKLTRRSASPYNELEDWEQSLAASVLEALPRYNPERAGLKTFINHISSSRVGVILNKERRLKRRGERLRLIGLPTDDALGDSLSYDGAFLFHVDFSAIELRCDLEKALRSSPRFLQEIFRILRDDALGRASQTLSRFQIRRGRLRLKAYLASWGLGDYLSAPSAHFSTNRIYKPKEAIFTKGDYS